MKFMNTNFESASKVSLENNGMHCMYSRKRGHCGNYSSRGKLLVSEDGTRLYYTEVKESWNGLGSRDYFPSECTQFSMWRLENGSVMIWTPGYSYWDQYNRHLGEIKVPEETIPWHPGDSVPMTLFDYQELDPFIEKLFA